jgi:hypothetical protein
MEAGYGISVDELVPHGTGDFVVLFCFFEQKVLLELSVKIAYS